jgi:predicted phosphodiesterase
MNGQPLCLRNFMIASLAIMLFDANSSSFHAQPIQTTPANFKVAFLGDQGLGTDAQAVLGLIKNEGASAAVHLGDFDYTDDPQAWEDQINGVLGKDFPYFACIGNHDEDKFYGAAGYQEFMMARMNRLGVTWSGDLGVKSHFKYHGILIVMTAPGVAGNGHNTYINNVLAADSSIWRVSSWHKNMPLMQVGEKTENIGWGVYEESRKGGAIVATGHEHSYSRTHLLSSCENQIVASTSDTLVLTRDQTHSPEDEGRSFVFVSGLGGKSIRSQKLNGDWWASIYTSTQKAAYGALFGVFNYHGTPNLATFYFKSINGAVPDSFYVLSKVAPAPLITAFTPPAAPAGTPVTISGRFFTGTTQINFNGIAATGFIVHSDAQISVNVPAGATTGKISVTTPTGTATSASDLTVIFPPSITAFTPGRAPAGSLVTITGSNFINIIQVAFNGLAAATFTVDSTTQIRAIVSIGATAGKISVTTPDGEATSRYSFIVQATAAVHNDGMETAGGPEEVVLEQNHPNPFNPSTAISFWVHKRMHVTLKIYNVTGQEVATLADGHHDRGRYTVTPEAANWLSGIYFAVMKAGQETQVRRMIFMK